MSPALRPMTIGEILDRTFQIYRSRFLVFAGIAALPAFTLLGITIANQFWWKLLPEEFMRRIFLWYTPQMLLYSLVLTHLEVLFSLLVYPVFAVVVSNCIFGEPSSLFLSAAKCVARWRSWIGLTGLNWCLSLVLPELALTALLAGVVYLLFEVLKMDADDPEHIGSRMFLAALILGAALFQWIGSGISCSLPTWILEEWGILASLRRSWNLSRKRRVGLISIRVAPALVAWFLTLAITRLAAVLLYLSTARATHWWLVNRNVFEGVNLLVGAVIAVLIGPFYPIALTLIYYDQRIRREGFDIERMLHAAGLESTAAAPTTDVSFAPVATEGPLA